MAFTPPSRQASAMAMAASPLSARTTATTPERWIPAITSSFLIASTSPWFSCLLSARFRIAHADGYFPGRRHEDLGEELVPLLARRGLAARDGDRRDDGGAVVPYGRPHATDALLVLLVVQAPA